MSFGIHLNQGCYYFLFYRSGSKGKAHVQRFVVGKGKAFSLSHTRERE